jgi:hypothetical protein
LENHNTSQNQSITQALIEAISEIGAGDELLVFKDIRQEFMHFAATFDGTIKLSMNNGEIQCTFTRDLIAKVVDDFMLDQGINELPLKKVRKSLDGNITIDDEEEQPVISDIDDIKINSDVPLVDRVVKTLENMQFSTNPRSTVEETETGSIMRWETEDDFDLTMIIDETKKIITFDATKPMMASFMVDLFLLEHEKSFPAVVKFSSHEVEVDNIPHSSFSFTTVLIAEPFIGQHLKLAMTSILQMMNLWRSFAPDNN